MSYTFLPNQPYRMPTHFGPATGPRRGQDGQVFDCKDSPNTTAYAASFLTHAEQLDALLPPGFILAGQPIVTFTATYMKNIQWLAGRGYNMLGVSFMATWQGKTQNTTGNFLAVLWENMADPIITGREELGYAKIFCDLPEPLVTSTSTRCAASWMGFDFFEMNFNTSATAVVTKSSTSAAQPASAGTLHYKYVPTTWQPGHAAVQHAVLTPAATPNRVVNSVTQGSAAIQFNLARWEDMPTQYMIVNALADLTLIESRGATVTQTTGGKDLSDMTILD